MKIKVIQFETREKESVKLSQEINKKYCDINGYDYEFELFKFEKEKYLDIINFSNEKNKEFMGITYHKFELIEKYIHDYDYIVFIDSDCVFNNPTISIESLIDDSHDFYISQDCTPNSLKIFLFTVANEYATYCKQNNISYIENFYEFSEKRGPIILNWTCLKMLGNLFTNPFGINDGFMILKNSAIIHDFIADLKKFDKLFFNAQEDQGCVSHLMTADKYKNMYKIFPIKFQGDSNLNHPDFGYNEEENFINHMAGATEEVRIAGMTTVKNNKWWNKYEDSFSIT